MKIGVIGECMLELSQVEGKTKLGFGGDTLNTAVYLARLLPKETFSVHYISALGCDPYSQMMLTSWQAEDIDTALVQQLPHKLPGLYSIITDEFGERSFYYWRNDSAAKYWLDTDLTDDVLNQLKSFDYLYFSGISLAILNEASRQKLFDFLPHFKANGGKIAFDNNYRPILWRDVESAQAAYQKILSFTDIAFLTLDDEVKLWKKDSLEKCIERTQQFGVLEIVIKRGADSCIVVHFHQRFDIPSQKIKHIIDTTAAGDSFSAGYLSARLEGRNEVESARQGHTLAGCVIGYRGAIIPKDAFSIRDTIAVSL
ncbi:sugar kinase [Rodentibacter myodis]|uniref:2-dehydro-3-deoxygluconokinase n=1 Tax=Rodentibacter myodis TaxID=1907939 RepID=A0A1V3JQI1_9PAST|nr:sugar kinase [Rodentibacter myodis]OOF58657.1 ketodeoxygluconokinase [Rodentibacter myodis]